MVKVYDGTGAIMGRLASTVAKELLRGEEVVVVNCNDVIISGNKSSIQEEFKQMRGRMGHGMRGPKHHKVSEKIVKRTVRGMIPNFREGRGKQVFSKLRCYNAVPKEYETVEKIKYTREIPSKFSRVKEFTK